MTNTHIAKLMWDAYAIQAGGKTFDGKPLPTWDELGEDRQSCWVAAASVTADRIEKLEAVLEVATMKRIINTDRIEKLEAALRKIKDLHHGPEDDDVLWIRDDMTYKIVCDTLEGKDGVI